MPCGKFRSPYLDKAQQLQEQAYPFLSVRAVFPCVQTIVWLPVFRIFNACTDVMHSAAHGGCTGSWLWQKNPLLHWGLEPASVLCLSIRHATNSAIPTPNCCKLSVVFHVFFSFLFFLFCLKKKERHIYIYSIRRAFIVLILHVFPCSTEFTKMNVGAGVSSLSDYH